MNISQSDPAQGSTNSEESNQARKSTIRSLVQSYSQRSNRFKYAIFGLCFGACFPLVSGAFIDQPQHLFAIICLAPFVLALVASIGGKKKDDVDFEVQLRTKDLQKAKEQAVQLLASKSTFLASMSHEIRTPLNGVLSCTNLLLDNLKQPEDIQLLQTIKDSGDSLLTLINDILDFSKIESEKISLENEPFNVRESLDQIIDLLSSKASENGISIQADCAQSEVNWIRGDVTRYRQVLTNLIGNAIKFTSTKVTVKLSSKPIDPSTNPHSKNNFNLLVEVSDDGIGISKTGQSKLFKSFSQADSSTTRKFGGTGLGLVICKGIVSAMRGEIGVNSREGEGATFYFSIPVKKCPAQKKSNRTSEFSSINKNMAVTFPLKILMAEDNRINQMVGIKLLEKLGYRIDIVANGLEAVAAVKKQSYDVILMDQHMPEMDGVDATLKIRKLPSHVHQPKICALTASAFKEDKERCLKAGMDHFLTKPIDIQAVVSFLKTCTTQGQVNASSADATEVKSVIDYDAVFAQFDGVTEVIPEIVNDCLAYLPELLDHLRTSVQGKDAKELRISAHTLKGVLANFKSELVIQLALNLEIRGRDNNFEDITQDMSALDEHLAIFMQDLKKLQQHCAQAIAN